LTLARTFMAVPLGRQHYPELKYETTILGNGVNSTRGRLF
jgi:hypothetical protein